MVPVERKGMDVADTHPLLCCLNTTLYPLDTGNGSCIMDPVMREELKMTRATKQEILELFCAAKSVEQISAKLDIDVDLVKEVIQNLRTVRYTPARQLFSMN